MITGSTKIVGVIGYPVEHTLSPRIHNKAFELLKLNCIYVPLKVPPEKLSDAIMGLRSLDLVGANVTIPHKQTVIQYLDEVSEAAQKIGSVNTIKNQNGKLIGYSTDMDGFVHSHEDADIQLHDKKILILGAGGAARSIALGLALQKLPSKITLLGRTVKKCKAISAAVNDISGSASKALELNSKNLQNEIPEHDILVNCTSIGMYPHIAETPVPQVLLRSGLVVHDIIYNPLQTRLLKDAEQKGCSTIDGLGMLIHQAIASFTIWTKQTPPIAPLREAALEQLINN